jgi:gas vesicle protein
MAAEDWIKGLVVGGLIGVVLGILYAPKSGKETREDLGRMADEMCEKTKLQYEQARGKIEGMASSGKESYADAKERLKKALDAGVEAYKKESAKDAEA